MAGYRKQGEKAEMETCVLSSLVNQQAPRCLIDITSCTGRATERGKPTLLNHLYYAFHAPLAMALEEQELLVAIKEVSALF